MYTENLTSLKRKINKSQHYLPKRAHLYMLWQQSEWHHCFHPRHRRYRHGSSDAIAHDTVRHTNCWRGETRARSCEVRNAAQRPAITFGKQGATFLRLVSETLIQSSQQLYSELHPFHEKCSMITPQQTIIHIYTNQFINGEDPNSKIL